MNIILFGYFSTKGFKEYIRITKRILDSNWTGSYTKPSPGLYPHQWNWDSGFIAIGYAHYNQKRAQQEILSLFEHQWHNGMVPQIVLNPEALGNYFPHLYISSSGHLCPIFKHKILEIVKTIPVVLYFQIEQI